MRTGAGLGEYDGAIAIVRDAIAARNLKGNPQSAAA
jgi:hypothetical protein